MTIDQLKEKARRIRIDTLDMILASGSGHLGGSFSATDIMVALYYGTMRIFPDPDHPDRDRFILSKGHAAPALYAILADKGYVDPSALKTLRRLGSPFQGHPDSAKCPGLDCTTGSLGQGISVGAGMAYGLKLLKRDARVYVLAGDGELNEGICWEAFMAAGNFGLDNLTIIVDRNRIQLSGRTEEIMALESLEAKVRSFGFDVDTIDGHDFSRILPALDRTVPGKPRCVIAGTIKGKGVSFMEDRVEWHGDLPKGGQIQEAYRELGGETHVR